MPIPAAPASQVIAGTTGQPDIFGSTAFGGNIYISQQTGDIAILNSSLTYTGTFDTGVTVITGNPAGLDNDGENLWVASPGGNCVYKFAIDGTLLQTINTDGSIAFSGPGDVKVGPGNTIWIADTGNNRIVVFDSNDFSFKFTFGVITGAPGDPYTMSSPYSLALDFTNEVAYVGDTGNGYVKSYDMNGVFISNVAVRGLGVGQLDSPFGVAVDGDSQIWIADNGSQKIVLLDSAGSLLTEYKAPTTSVENVGSFAFANDNLYMTDTSTSPVYNGETVLWTWLNVPAQTTTPPTPTPQEQVPEIPDRSFFRGGQGLGESLPGTLTPPRGSSRGLRPESFMDDIEYRFKT